MTEIDRELRARFDELRVRDAESAPAFRTLWARAEQGSHARQLRSRRALWLAAAGFVALTAGLAIRDAGRNGTRSVAPPPVSDAIVELMRWTPPTDGFLPAPAQAMGASILRSVFDGLAPAPIDTSSFKGD